MLALLACDGVRPVRAGVAVIPVNRLRALADSGYTAAYDFVGNLKSALPPDGVVLSSDEVAEVGKNLYAAALLADGYGKPETAAKFRAALSLLDSASED